MFYDIVFLYFEMLKIWIYRDSEIAESKKEIGTLKQEIERLDSEREILLSKIEAGDGVNTALQQLKQQNVSFLVYSRSTVIIYL